MWQKQGVDETHLRPPSVQDLQSSERLMACKVVLVAAGHQDRRREIRHNDRINQRWCLVLVLVWVCEPLEAKRDIPDFRFGTAVAARCVDDCRVG
jgi:hypothetical protein